MMATSFPLKMTEAWSLGLPVLVWGPEDSSAVRLVRELGGGIAVVDPDPAALGQAWEQFKQPTVRQPFARQVTETIQREFAPDRLLERFQNVLMDAVQHRNTKKTSCPPNG